jgi:hypothetical protein
MTIAEITDILLGISTVWIRVQLNFGSPFEDHTGIWSVR